MGKIKKILEKELGSTQSVEVYPVTSTKAVYNGANENLEQVLQRTPSIKNSDVDFEISDEKGNVLVQFRNGHIKTKEFDSSIGSTIENPLYGKKLSILGDSISTFGTPDQSNSLGTWTYAGNRCRYPQSNLLTDVNSTWWKRLLDTTGAILGINESWAGSRVSNTQSTDSGDLGPNRCISSITRISHLRENGEPDIILVYAGTNDAGNSVDIGTFSTENPMNYTESEIKTLDVSTFANAYRAMLIRLQYYYPNSKVIVMMPNFTTSYYTITNLDKYIEVIKEACDFFGVEYIDLRTSGITIYNRDTYLPDGIHPNSNGMELITDCVLKHITGNISPQDELSSSLKNKKISIIGDSISTCNNNNAVEFTVLLSDIGKTITGYPTYYDIGTTIGGITITEDMIGVQTSFIPTSNDVGKVIGKSLNYNTDLNDKQTWWGILAEKIGADILQNVSWSGASISSHESSQDKYKTSYAWHDAQINKLSKRDGNGQIIEPDIVIIYRGTNDMTHTPYTKITDFGAKSMSIPSTDSVNDGYGFKEAYCMTVKKIREKYPNAYIVCCTLNVFKRINYSEYPTNNGINTLPEYNNAIREVADYMGCGLIEFDKDGITFENCYPTYISDSSTIPTHPNANGHNKMAERAYKDLITLI